MLNKLDLGAAAIAYAKHGISISDASISVFKTKYTYNLIRTISYIQIVMGHKWNTLIPTPSHPEYTPAHAVASAASALVMDEIFGYNYSFTDHSYDATWGHALLIRLKTMQMKRPIQDSLREFIICHLLKQD